ncbi:indolethylamine N-methyltransferase-like [Lissotriton helveticus]
MLLSSKDVQQEPFNARLFLTTFFSEHTVINKQDMFGFPLEHLHELFKPGGIKGRVLFSLAFGPTFLQVLPACEHFEEIYMATSFEACVAEYQKWLRNEPDAFDWTPHMKQLCTLEGDMEKYAEKERVLRATIKQCLTFDMTKSNPFHPVVLPAADCVILYLILEPLGKDKETCIEYLRKVVAQIKDGGHLVIYAILGLSFFRLGQQRFPCFTYDQQFVLKALDDIGYEMHYFSCTDRTDLSNTSYADYKKIAVFAAKKKRQPVVV